MRTTTDTRENHTITKAALAAADVAALCVRHGYLPVAED